MNNGEVMHNADAMRMTGVCLFAVSVVQMGVSATAYDITTFAMGSWWAGMMVAVTGLFAMISNKRWAATLGVAFATIATILCFVGTIIDGMNSAAFRQLDICYNPETQKIYGESNVKNSSSPCMLDLIRGNATVSDSVDCVCSVNTADDFYGCADITLRGNTEDCGVLLFFMPELLLASCLILLSLFIMVIFYCCLSCRSICRSDRTVGPDAPVPTNATYFVVTAAEQPAPVLLNPADVTSTRMVDVEEPVDHSNNNYHGQSNANNNYGNSNSNSNTNSFAYGGTITATPVTAYPVKT